MTAWTGRERERLTRPTAVVSVRKCQVGPAGFQDYLGEQFDKDSGQWRELYGRKAELTLGLDLYAPEETEGAELERRAGGLSPFLAAFFWGRKLTPAEAEELKELIDRTTWEG